MKNIQKLVSVLMPCYNAEKTIERAIESVYVQNYSQIELVVVDDGSSDSSASIIYSWQERFQEKGLQLKYLYQENKGVGAAINTGLKHITGEYLTLLDADDRYLQGSIGKRVLFLEENKECAGVKCNGWMINKGNRQLFVQSEDEKKITDLFLALVEGKTNNWPGSYMVRTEILFSFYTDREIYPSRFGQNLQIIMPVAYKRKFGYLDEPLMEYIIQENSITKTQGNQYEKDTVNSCGYKDIYQNVLASIVQDEIEYVTYMKIIEDCFCRSEMLRAISYEDERNAKRSYAKLRERGCCTLDDHIAFYRTFYPIVGVFLRCVRKGTYYCKIWKNQMS